MNVVLRELADIIERADKIEVDTVKGLFTLSDPEMPTKTLIRYVNKCMKRAADADAANNEQQADNASEDPVQPFRREEA